MLLDDTKREELLNLIVLGLPVNKAVAMIGIAESLARRQRLPSPQRQHLDTKGEGVFHIGFEVDDADAAEARARGQGLPVLMRGRRANRTGFTYYATADQAGVTLLTRATNLPGR